MWYVECQWSMEELKKRLTITPVLMLPDDNNDFVVYNDASQKGMGCMLIQNERIVLYISRQLKSHERNYLIHDLKLVAVVFTLKVWGHYLYERWCQIFSDHHSLKYITTQKELNLR